MGIMRGSPILSKDINNILYFVNDDGVYEMAMNIDDYYQGDYEKLLAENKRLKAQLKELREELAKYKAKEDTQEKAVEKAIESMNNIVDDLDGKIDEVCARTLCDRKEALDILTKTDYNVDIAIAHINWSKLNVPSEIL